MVGRDLLVGSLFGILLALTGEIVNALPAWFNLAGQTPISGDKFSMFSAPQCLGYLILNMVGGLYTGLTLVFALFVIRTTVKNYWMAMLVMGTLIMLTSLGNENVVAETIAAIITACLIVILSVQFDYLE